MRTKEETEAMEKEFKDFFLEVQEGLDKYKVDSVGRWKFVLKFLGVKGNIESLAKEIAKDFAREPGETPKEYYDRLATNLLLVHIEKHALKKEIKKVKALRKLKD